MPSTLRRCCSYLLCFVALAVLKIPLHGDLPWRPCRRMYGRVCCPRNGDGLLRCRRNATAVAGADQRPVARVRERSSIEHRLCADYELASRGGMASMLATIWPLIAALVFASAVKKIGVLVCLITSVIAAAKSIAALVAALVSAVLATNVATAGNILRSYCRDVCSRQPLRNAGLRRSFCPGTISASGTPHRRSTPGTVAGLYGSHARRCDAERPALRRLLPRARIRWLSPWPRPVGALPEARRGANVTIAARKHASAAPRRASGRNPVPTNRGPMLVPALVAVRRPLEPCAAPSGGSPPVGLRARS